MSSLECGDVGGAAGASSADSRMREFNHSPSVSPERRAANLATSRASGSMPFTLHGIPGFIALLFRAEAPAGAQHSSMPQRGVLSRYKVNILGKHSVKYLIWR